MSMHALANKVGRSWECETRTTCTDPMWLLAAANHDLLQPFCALALYVDALKGTVNSEGAALVAKVHECVVSQREILKVSQTWPRLLLAELGRGFVNFRWRTYSQSLRCALWVRHRQRV